MTRPLTFLAFGAFLIAFWFAVFFGLQAALDWVW